MNLNEFTENRKIDVIQKALREHYETKIDFNKYSLNQATSMLSKVKGLMAQVKSGSKLHESHKSPGYMKLLMIEQALTMRVNDLRSNPASIVVENEEVQKAQVTLAAQDMIDSVQKMLEQVSKMNVEELDAVVNGMKNEFGNEVGDAFAASTGEALSTLQAALQTAKTALTTALGSATGEGPLPGSEMGEPDLGAEPSLGDEMGGDDLGAEPGLGDEMDMEEPEPEDSGSVIGRGRR